MKAATLYRGEFLNIQATPPPENAPDQQLVIVTLHDMDDMVPDDHDQTFYQLDMDENPVTLSVIDQEEDKFNSIRATQAIIRIHSTPSISIHTFASGSDKRWKVEVAVNDPAKPHFIGFLSMSDLAQEFRPDPAIIQLTASDGLGSLKDVALVDLNDKTPRNENRIAEYLAWALRKTGLELDIYVINNIREKDFPEQHLYEAIYLDAKTFEAEIGECEDCYRVLEKILGESCFITQWKGAWWIQNVDEWDTNQIRVARFNSSGEFVQFEAPTNFYKIIGVEEDMRWIDSPFPLLTLERPYQAVKETFRYEYPKEIVDNIDFTRGDVIMPIIVPGGLAYTIDDWTADRGIPSIGSPSVTPYIKRLFDGSYETERYVVFPPTTGTVNNIHANPIYIHEGDKFSFSIDHRYSENVTGSSGTSTLNVAHIRLVGDDGTYWNLYGERQTDAQSRWVETNSSYSTNQSYVVRQWDITTTNETDWATVTAQAPPAPVSGELEIVLIQSNLHGTHYETHFFNLRLDYQPKINGTYGKFTGQYHKVSQDVPIKAMREKQVHISDSQKRLFKGALLKKVNDKFVLAELFYAQNVVPVGVPSAEYLHPYGRMQVFSVWNQYNRIMRKFEGDIDGLQSDAKDDFGFPDTPSVIHKYFLFDANPNTNNKYFQLIHYKQDLHLCRWSALLYEVFDTGIPKQYEGHEFKYISE